MNPDEAYARLNPEEQAEVIANLRETLRQEFERADFNDLSPSITARRSAGEIVHAAELLFRGAVNGLYLVVNLAVLAGADNALGEVADPGLGDNLLFIVLPIMLIARLFRALVALLGKLGYRKALTKYGMIKAVSRVSTWIVVTAGVVVAVLWILDRAIGGKQEDRE
jgi:hypothetical protein